MRAPGIINTATSDSYGIDCVQSVFSKLELSAGKIAGYAVVFFGSFFLLGSNFLSAFIGMLLIGIWHNLSTSGNEQENQQENIPGRTQHSSTQSNTYFSNMLHTIATRQIANAINSNQPSAQAIPSTRMQRIHSGQNARTPPLAIQGGSPLNPVEEENRSVDSHNPNPFDRQHHFASPTRPYKRKIEASHRRVSSADPNFLSTRGGRSRLGSETPPRRYNPQRQPRIPDRNSMPTQQVHSGTDFQRFGRNNRINRQSNRSPQGGQIHSMPDQNRLND